jgi:GAF domain-containing protein
MIFPGIPHNEAERIAVLRELLVLDTAPEDRYDTITSYCQSRFDVEIAVVSLVDADRQWFKSICGLDAKETPRNISFCGHAILEDKVMEVRDALRDERFADNPLVLGPPLIRFYAGAPLKHSSGQILGTLCLIDSKPKRLEPEELEHLVVLAHMVTMELENQGRMDSCEGYCIYSRLSVDCPHRNTKYDLPK